MSQNAATLSDDHSFCCRIVFAKIPLFLLFLFLFSKFCIRVGNVGNHGQRGRLVNLATLLFFLVCVWVPLRNNKRRSLESHRVNSTRTGKTPVFFLLWATWTTTQGKELWMMEACIEIATIISMGRNRIKTNTKTAVNIQVNNVYNPYMCSLSSLFHISKDFTSRKRDEENVGRERGGGCIRKGLFVFFFFFFIPVCWYDFQPKKKRVGWKYLSCPDFHSSLADICLLIFFFLRQKENKRNVVIPFRFGDAFFWQDIPSVYNFAPFLACVWDAGSTLRRIRSRIAPNFQWIFPFLFLSGRKTLARKQNKHQIFLKFCKKNKNKY